MNSTRTPHKVTKRGTLALLLATVPLLIAGETKYDFTVLCSAAGPIPAEDAHAEATWLCYWTGSASLSEQGV
jgi:hypothetical protein